MAHLPMTIPPRGLKAGRPAIMHYTRGQATPSGHMALPSPTDASPDPDSPAADSTPDSALTNHEPRYVSMLTHPASVAPLVPYSYATEVPIWRGMRHPIEEHRF